MVLKKRERSELPFIFAQRYLWKNKDALSRDFRGGTLRSRFFSTTPLASCLGSLPLLSQEGKLFLCSSAVANEKTRLMLTFNMEVCKLHVPYQQE